MRASQSPRSRSAGTTIGPVGASPRRAAVPSTGLTGPGNSAPCSCGGSCPRCADRGRPIDTALRGPLEASFGTSLASVRIHTDSAAQQLAREQHAQALTIGPDIYFARGRYAPHTPEGATRLAHEVVHTRQQAGASASDPLSEAPSGAEHEARQLAASATLGQPVRVSQRAPLAVQRDGDGSPPTPAPAGDTQLHLDPDIQRMMMQNYIRWWLGSTLVDGSPPVGPAPTTPTLRPDFFAPLPPDPRWVPPDYSGLYGDYNQRGVAPADRDKDQDVMTGLYTRNLALAQAMPDLRAMAPSVFRGLIPTTWRRDVATALTSAAATSTMKNDPATMTPLEIADRSYQSMTGVSTTVINLPALHF